MREDSDHVLILAGDHTYRMDYLRMLEFHIEREADLTLAAVEMPATESGKFGVLEVDQSNSVLGFKEKPQHSSSIPGKPGRVYASMGIYILRVHSFASVEDSVLMDGVDVGRHVRIRRAIIDKNTQILAGTRIGYELENDRKRFTVTDSGIVVIPRERIIGPDSDVLRWHDLAKGAQISPSGPKPWG